MSRSPSPIQLALLSAASPIDLDAAAEALRAHRSAADPAPAVHIYALDPGAAPYRAALLPDSAARLTAAPNTRNGAVSGGARPASFMFSGLGDHYIDMGLDLYRDEPTFREQIDRCAELLKPHLGLDIRGVLYPTGERAADPPPKAPAQGIDLRRMLGRERQAPTAHEARLNQTRLAHPALFAVEYALARLWQAWGLCPDAMIGYSLGEYVAACIAGVLSLEDALALVARRAEMIEELPPGAMLAVNLSEAEMAPHLGEHLSIAAINGPTFCVIAGPPEPVHALEKRLAELGVAARPVKSSHAFHTRMMDPITARVTTLVETLKLSPPRIPYVSNVSGALITAAQATDPSYWAMHLCRPVRFGDGIRALVATSNGALLEVGPGQTLSSLAILGADGAPAPGRIVIPSMRHAYEVQSDMAFLLNALGRLWVAGAALEWSRFPSASLTITPGAAADRAEAAEPWTQTERELAAIWQKLLSVEQVEPGANFFELGGNSLIATRLIYRVLKAFRVTLSLRRIYEAPTIASMAGEIDALRGGATATGSPGAQRSKDSQAKRRYRLPNGLTITHQSEAETRHFYEDIFAHRSYVKNGVRIPPAACVFDVGANIGLFTLFVHTEAKDARIFSFEPAPPLFEIVSGNVADHRVNATLFNYGLSDREREAAFTFYPHSSGMSTFHADEAEERHVLKTIIDNQRQSGALGVEEVAPHAEELLDARFEARPFTAKLRRLSDVIREHAVERIDVLKIDVQKCELEVIEGIDEGDWPKIAQVVLEAHDIDGRVSALSAMLERRGFKVIAEQDALYVGTNIHNIYAVRGG